MASNNVQLLYQHPHIMLYLEDNTIQHAESSVESDSGLYGIQVGAFESGRDNVVLRYTNTEQMISELGDLNHEVYGQAGYNAYNALNSKSCGMYIMRCMPDDATYANRVIMAKFKVLKAETAEDTPVVEHVDTSAELVTGKNLFSDMGSSTLGNFAFYGNVVSGMTGIAEIDGLFSHITPDWLNGKNLPKFSPATVRVNVPNGVTPGATVKITQISKALKNFYADFGLDSDIVAGTGNTATKTKEYPLDVILPDGAANFEFSFLVQENDTVSVSIEWNDADATVTDYTFNSANVAFTDAVATVDDEVGVETTPVDKTRLDISYYATSFENVRSEDELKLKFAALFSENVDEEGYYHMPAMLFYSLGRGLYGNNLRIKFSDAMEYDGDITPFRRYCITIMQITKEGLKAKEYIRGGISETAWDDTQFADGLPAYLQDLTNDIEYGSQKINLEMCEQTFEKMLELYNTEVADGETVEEVTMDSFDPIFGLDMTGEMNDSILRSNYVGEDGDAINLEAIDGFELSGGSDGSMTYKAKMTADEQAAYDKAYENALIRAFQPITVSDETGTSVELPVHDKMLKSRYSTPADFMFDANFPDSVKVAMAKFASEREYDCMTYLDAGLCQTVTETMNWLRSMKDIYAYNVVKELHCYKYRDSRFTRKVVPMTITHWLSGALPFHLSTYGLSTPFARKYARLVAGTDFIAGSFGPIIDPDDNEVKKAIYKYRANCYESLDRKTVQRSSAITTCQEASDRMEEFNEYIVHKAVKIAYEIMNSNIYNMVDEDSILAYTEHAEKQISFVLGGLVRKVTVNMTSSDADRKKSIMRLVMHIEFNTVAKYGVVEIYLDPRGTADAAEAALMNSY